MSTTDIEWTDSVWNPTRGCSRVSDGCRECFAMKQAHRFAGPGKPYDGLTTIRRGKVDWQGFARLHSEMLDQPLRWQRPRRIFVNSMSDLFHESLTNEEIAAVFAVMAKAYWHTFQVLTKRPERMRDWFLWLRTTEGAIRFYELCKTYNWPSSRLAEVNGGAGEFSTNTPLPNVWLGVTAEDQKRADERIPLLLLTPAAVRFVSAEPLLGPVDFLRTPRPGEMHDFLTGEKTSVREKTHTAKLDWVIVGGESGPGARPCALEWGESIVQQCRAAGVAVFFKQLGAYVVSEDRTYPVDVMADVTGRQQSDYDQHRAPDGTVWAWRAGLRHKKGADPSEWPEKLRVREFPEVRNVQL